MPTTAVVHVQLHENESNRSVAKIVSHHHLASGLLQLPRSAGRPFVFGVSAWPWRLPRRSFSPSRPDDARGAALARRGRGCVPHRCVVYNVSAPSAWGSWLGGVWPAAPAGPPGCCRRPLAYAFCAFSPPSFGRRPWRVFAAREPASPAATGKFRATRVGEASLSTLAPGKPWAAPAAAPLPRRLTHSLCQQRIHPSARRPAPLPDRRRCFRSSSRCAFSAPLGSWWAP